MFHVEQSDMLLCHLFLFFDINVYKSIFCFVFDLGNRFVPFRQYFSRSLMHTSQEKNVDN
jgi:hypothetical protein